MSNQEIVKSYDTISRLNRLKNESMGIDLATGPDRSAEVIQKKVTVVHFEDHGQDFLIWTIDPETGKVIKCEPFQASFWVGCIVIKNSLIRGSQIEYHHPRFADDGCREIKYPIEKIETKFITVQRSWK